MHRGEILEGDSCYEIFIPSFCVIMMKYVSCLNG